MRRWGACGRFGGLGARSLLAIGARPYRFEEPPPRRLDVVRRGLYRSSARWSFSLSSSVSLLGAACAWVVREPVGAARDRALAPSPGRRGAAAVVAEARDAFQALSSEALRQTSSSFLEVAKTQLTGHVAPLKDSLERMDRQMSGMEKVRQEAYGAVTQHLNTLAGTQERLRLETGNLVKALRTPHVRGRWGEVQLRNVVEAAGMLAALRLPGTGVDARRRGIAPAARPRRPHARRQAGGGRREGAARRVPGRLRGGGRRRSRRAISRITRGRCATTSASSRRSAYWRQFEPSPDFVIMFLPGETFFRAAQEQDACSARTAAARRDPRLPDDALHAPAARSRRLAAGDGRRRARERCTSSGGSCTRGSRR